MPDSELDDLLKSPSLKELVDEPELAGLFSDDRQDIARTVRELVNRALEDGDFQSRLADALEVAVDENLGEDEAALWIVAILAESRSQAAIHTLLRSFALEDEESLSQASGIALLRIGVPALEALMEWVDEEPGLDLRRQTYGLLGDCGVLEEQEYLEDIREFLRARTARELGKPAGERALEEAAAAIARLGDHSFLDDLRRILMKDYGGANPGLQDSIELLEENPESIPFIPTISPWEECYGWIFEEDLESHRVNRAQGDGGEATSHHHDHDHDHHHHHDGGDDDCEH
ncbi:MAG: hypothetical protein VX675_05830 [Planctomycetota bacterium]|nr:hypothetical protein [Planctomycetota bacterium]